MSRPRRKAPETRPGMPVWLAEYRPELWSQDPDDDVERYYFGRFRWEDARAVWAAGGTPVPYVEIPRPLPRGSDNMTPVPTRTLGGSDLNRTERGGEQEHQEEAER